MWGFWFRNQKHNPDFVRELHVRSEATIPEDIPPQIQEGLDDGLRELLSQAASARQLWTHRLNPKVTPVRDYLKDNNLMVKPTDKNLGLAAFPALLYYTEMVKHIKEGPYEEVVYTLPLAKDFHSDILKRLPKTGLTKAEVRYIRQHREISWPAFHMIPKVHKSPWAWRPIVPAHSSPTARISKVADIAIASLLPRFPHLIRSTAEWLRHLSDGWNKRNSLRDQYFVTGDVVAFYTNVDTDTIHLSMEALLRGSRIPDSRAKAIAELVRIITHKNFFAIEDIVFRQTSSLAMGSPCSGTVANLTMARRERRFVNREGVLAYTRYIDDIFCLIEARNEIEVRRILQEISEAVHPLQIKWNVSRRRAVYLDAEVAFSPFIGLTYKPYRKPGSQHAYLPWSSAHPTYVKKGLVIGETTRLSLLC